MWNSPLLTLPWSTLFWSDRTYSSPIYSWNNCSIIYERLLLSVTWKRTTLCKLFVLDRNGLVGRVFINGPGDLGSIPGHVRPKTLNMVLDTYLLNTQQYKVRIKGKVKQFMERSSASPTTRSSSYWKGSLLVALDYGCQLSFTYFILGWANCGLREPLKK